MPSQTLYEPFEECFSKHDPIFATKLGFSTFKRKFDHFLQQIQDLQLLKDFFHFKQRHDFTLHILSISVKLSCSKLLF